MRNLEEEAKWCMICKIAEIAMGQIHNEDETSKECGDLIGHDFSQEIPKEIYDLTKEELISVLRRINEIRQFEEQFDYSNL